jgi:hypothetical protein
LTEKMQKNCISNGSRRRAKPDEREKSERNPSAKYARVSQTAGRETQGSPYKSEQSHFQQEQKILKQKEKGMSAKPVFFCRGANAAPCTPGARACGILYWQVVCVCGGGSTHVSQSFTLCRLFWRQEG